MYVCVWGVFTCMCECRCPRCSEKGIRSAIAGVTGGVGTPDCGCWELSSGPVQDQYSTLTTEPFLSPSMLSFLTLIVVLCCERKYPY